MSAAHSQELPCGCVVWFAVGIAAMEDHAQFTVNIERIDHGPHCSTTVINNLTPAAPIR